MGGSSSKAKSEIVTKVITEVITKDLMNCSTMVTQQQSIDISGDGNALDGVSMKQGFKINISCIQNSNRKQNLDNAIANAVTQQADAEGVALVGVLGSSKSEVYSRIVNVSRNEITMQSLVNCATAINNTQGISVSGNYNLLRNISLDQFGTMVQSCVQKIVSNTSIINDIKNATEQEATAITEGPLDFIAEIFTGPTSIIIAIIVLIVIIAGAYLVLGGGGATEEDETLYRSAPPLLNPSLGPGPGPASTNALPIITSQTSNDSESSAIKALSTALVLANQRNQAPAAVTPATPAATTTPLPSAPPLLEGVTVTV